jgi:hypothetical protein
MSNCYYTTLDAFQALSNDLYQLKLPFSSNTAAYASNLVWKNSNLYPAGGAASGALWTQCNVVVQGSMIVGNSLSVQGEVVCTTGPPFNGAHDLPVPTGSWRVFRETFHPSMEAPSNDVLKLTDGQSNSVFDVMDATTYLGIDMGSNYVLVSIAVEGPSNEWPVAGKVSVAGTTVADGVQVLSWDPDSPVVFGNDGKLRIAFPPTPGRYVTVHKTSGSASGQWRIRGLEMSAMAPGSHFRIPEVYQAQLSNAAMDSSVSWASNQVASNASMVADLDVSSVRGYRVDFPGSASDFLLGTASAQSNANNAFKAFDVIAPEFGGNGEVLVLKSLFSRSSASQNLGIAFGESSSNYYMAYLSGSNGTPLSIAYCSNGQPLAPLSQPLNTSTADTGLHKVEVTCHARATQNGNVIDILATVDGSVTRAASTVDTVNAVGAPMSLWTLSDPPPGSNNAFWATCYSYGPTW